MKKLIPLILTAAMTLTLAACTAAPDPAPLATPTPEPTAAAAAPTPEPMAAAAAPTTVKPARPISRGGRGGTQFLRQEIPSMSITHCSTAIPKLGRNTLTSTASPS